MSAPVWLVQTVPPAETPVTIAEAKDWLRVDHDEEDAAIHAIVRAATAELDGKDGILGRALVTQTWRADYDAFPTDDVLRLPLYPVQSATVAYWDADNTDQVLASESYILLVDIEGAYLSLTAGSSWPAAYARDDAVRVTFIAGDDVSAVSAAIKQSILLRIGDLYQNREAAIDGSVAVNPTHRAMTMPHWRPFV